MKHTHVYQIKDFKREATAASLYINRLGEHVKNHAFTNLPHKHDFYLFMLVTKGYGTHEIDFVKYQVRPGSLFMMQPGQMHFWELSKDIDGFVFFHSKDFYEQEYTRSSIHQFKFFQSFQSVPAMVVNKKTSASLALLLSEMYAESKSNRILSSQKLHALVELVYIEASRAYPHGEAGKSSRYQKAFHQFEKLVEMYYFSEKLPRYYAAKLNMTEKHLNRICRECVNKTSTNIIAERVILESKRRLSQFQKNVTEIGFDLGFNDPSYFVRFFKKHTGETPLNFQKKHFGAQE